MNCRRLKVHAEENNFFPKRKNSFFSHFEREFFELSGKFLRLGVRAEVTFPEEHLRNIVFFGKSYHS